jgi:hypothetical protein
MTYFKDGWNAGPPWLTSVILATWEAETRRSWFEANPREIVLETPSPK